MFSYTMSFSTYGAVEVIFQENLSIGISRMLSISTS